MTEKTKTTKKETTKNLIIKIGNLSIEKGKRYVLDHKFDGGAPSGLKEIKATRLPFANNNVSDCVEFDDSKRVYDTGFDINSKCLSQYTQAEKEEWVSVYNKEIKLPYEQATGVSLSNNKDNDFYKEYRYDLYVNKEFDTSKPIDLFDLFNALLQGLVCAKDERNPFYANTAQFNLSNPSEIKNKNKEKTKKLRTAIEKFNIMVDSHREKLDLILEFIGRDNPSKIESEDLKDIYFDVLNSKKDSDFVERFLDASSKYDTEVGKEEIEWFSVIKKLLKASKIKKDRQKFVTSNDQIFLGNTLTDIAKFCMNKNSQQYKLISDLSDELD